MAKSKAAQKDDWQDLPVEADDWEDLPANPSAARGNKVSTARKMAAGAFPPLALANIAQELTGADPATAAAHAADTMTLGNARYFDRAKAYLEKSEKENPGSAKFGKGAGYAGLGAASMLAGGIPAMMAVGAAQGVGTKPEGDNSLKEDLGKRTKQGLIGAGTALAVGGLAKGATKIGDRVMQKAVNAKDYVKGMGNRMADEGLIGTKEMMKNQVAKKLPKREADLTEAARRVKGAVRPTRAWRDILAEGDAYKPSSPTGRPIAIPSENQPFVNLSQTRAQEALTRGSLTPTEAIDTARKVAKPAYNKVGDPLDAFKHKISQTEAIALKDAVKELADAQGIPGVRQALSSEQALINARNGLNRTEPMSEALIRQLVRGSLGAGVGAGFGGVPGAVAGAAATTPMGLSAIGQLGTQGGKVLPSLTPAAIDALIKQTMRGE